MPWVTTKDLPLWPVRTHPAWAIGMFRLQIPDHSPHPQLMNFTLCMGGPIQQGPKGTIIFCVAVSFLQLCSAVSTCSPCDCPCAVWSGNASPGRKLGGIVVFTAFISLSHRMPSCGVFCPMSENKWIIFCSRFQLLTAGGYYIGPY